MKQHFLVIIFILLLSEGIANAWWFTSEPKRESTSSRRIMELEHQVAEQQDLLRYWRRLGFTMAGTGIFIAVMKLRRRFR